MQQQEKQELSEIGALVDRLVRALVDHPEQVTIKELVGTQSTVLEVHVARTDYGHVVGKKGRTADAIRELLVDMSGKVKRRYILEILE